MSEGVQVTGYGTSGADAGNYSFSQPVVANVTISADPITIAATNQSKTYGFGGTGAALGTSAYSVSSVGTIQGSDTISSVTPDAGGHQLAGHQRLGQPERGQL